MKTTTTTTMIGARAPRPPKLLRAAGALALALVSTAAGVAAQVRGNAVALINCGSYENATVAGQEWESDKVHEYYANSGGGSFGLSVAATLPVVSSSNETDAAERAVLYETYRLFKKHKPAPYRYQIPVPAALETYLVELHFAEMEYSAAQERVFNVSIQGVTAHEFVDVWALAGGAARPVTLASEATVVPEEEEGAAPTIEIDLVAVARNPVIAAIGIYEAFTRAPTVPTNAPTVSPTASPAPSTQPTPEPVLQTVSRINCGGDAFTDSSGAAWEADNENRYYRFGGTRGVSIATSTPISGTDDGFLYQSARQFKKQKPGPYLYQIPVPVAGASYAVDLHFAEIHRNRQTEGRRRFSVAVEGVSVASPLDIVQAAGGGYRAVILSTNVVVNDEFLTIELGLDKFHPIISAIAVFLVTPDGEGMPTPAPTWEPSQIPTAEPTPEATFEPTQIPATEPSSNPSLAPSLAPTGAPSFFASPDPTIESTTTEPSMSPPPSQFVFEPVLINAGGADYDDVKGRSFASDEYFTDGETYSLSTSIDGTADDPLYQTQRYGPLFSYNIPLPEGNYEIIIHFCELDDSNVTHVFDVEIGGTPTFVEVDVSALVGDFYAMTLETVAVITEGSLPILFSARSGHAIVSAIEINLLAPHLAHAVSGTAYTAVDVDGDGIALVPVDGTASHTHAPGHDLIEWKWYEGTNLVGDGEVTSLQLSVGEHFVTLRVVDDDGNESAETAIVTVLEQGYPVASTITPSTGDINGMNAVTITGFGYNFPAAETIVHFGFHDLTGAQIYVVNPTTIVVYSPSQSLAIPVPVSVSTPIGTSNSLTYTYLSGQEILWSRASILDIYGPTAIAFDHNKKLYIGTIDGKVAKLTLNDDGDTIVESLVSTVVGDSDPQSDRSILGLAFDPMDAGLSNPPVYLSHSQTFHGDSVNSTSGKAINGKISQVSGANLDVLTDIVVGLPVSDHDHAVNGLEFTDHGSLLVLVGGNTNGGVPGALSGSQVMKDSVLSAALLEVHLSKPDFDGFLTYDAHDDGNLVGSSVGSVEVYASGMRSAYDFIIHSNGKIYGTDNGPNLSYGDMSTSCSSSKPDVQEADKLNLIEKGGYYGHPNRKRGASDPRQCVWRSAHEASDGDDYTAPMAILPASSNGIVEYQSSAFGNQMRGNLLIAKYKGDMYRAILNEDGTAVVPETNPPVLMHSDSGLDLTQGPDSKLWFVRYKGGKVRYLAPNEEPSSSMVIASVFPRRGSQLGGTVLNVFGQHLLGTTASTTVSVGGKPCVPVLSVSAALVRCILPGGTAGTAADILVANGSEAATFPAGYRYITGLPEE